ncbi:MAG: hypothetical protein Q8M29_08265 [Bacteroidota bacterium]|nr:hypothetical protein [Bacteroidota bacterium]
MKKSITLILALFLTINLFAQAPQKMSYQAVIRNSSSSLVTSTTVGMQISILQGSSTGTPVYIETQTPTSNVNGLVSLEIGTGSIVTGTFSGIDWAAGPYFIKTETDPLGGTAYTIIGTSELLSVPYALHAKTAESITGGITENDPIFVASPANGINTSDISNWNNKLDTEVDGSVTNELQALSISYDTIYLSNGGYVKLPASFDGQYSSLTGVPINVSTFSNDAGYLSSEVDGSVTNELQALSIGNDTIYLSNGGFIKLPSANAWSLNGNAGTVDGSNFIGTTDNVPLNFKVNNEPSGRIEPNKYSTFFGYQSGKSNISGIFNTAVGEGSLFSNTDGNYNTAFGAYSLYNNTTGSHNTAIGKAVLLTNTTGHENTSIGLQSMYNNTTGYLNTAVGYDALLQNSTGNNNVAIGTQSGRNNLGSDNVFLGYQAGYNETGSNKLYISNSATNPPLIYGDFSNGNVGIGNNNPSARLHIGNGTRFAAAADASIFLQSGNGVGSARDWKIYVPMTNGYLAFRDMGFDNLNNGMATDAMAIQSGTGNVGIGTTNPGAKLEVQGTVKIVDGTQGVNKVLTSDATGIATWEAKESKAYGMIYRTTAFDIPAVTVWTDIPLDGGENNLINVAHSTTTNSERVTVNVSGTYLIQYIVHYRRRVFPHHGVSRLIKNSSDEITGSYTVASPISGDGNEEDPLSTQVITTLSANDYINIQVATNYNVTDEVDSYYGPDLPVPTTKISVSLTIVKIGD